MTEIESLKILAVLKAAFPVFYYQKTQEEIDDIVNLWADMFNEPYEVVGMAVKSFIATETNGRPPTIGQVKNKIIKITTPDMLTEVEAVNLIMNATRNSLYNATSEFNKLPPVLQKLVGTPMQLREWAVGDSQTINTVVSSNLQRSYKVLAERERDYLALPESIKQHIRLSASSNM